MCPHVGQLLRNQRLNTTLGWLLVGALVAAVARSLYAADLLWTSFAAAVLALTLLPPLVLRDPRVMLPWEIVGLAALPVLGRAFASVPVTGQIATYLSVAAIALVVAVELHLFTPVRMSERFAVAFVVVGTMAMAGIWAVLRWMIDRTLGTTFLVDPALPEEAIHHMLMVEFVASTAAGVLAGVVFSQYVGRRIVADVRLPEGHPK